MSTRLRNSANHSTDHAPSESATNGKPAAAAVLTSEPTSDVVQVLISEFAENQAVKMQRIVLAAAKADGKSLDDGWRLNFDTSKWVLHPELALAKP